MRRRQVLCTAAAFSAVLLLQTAARADEKQKLAVLYVGNTDTPRSRAFAAFLMENFERAEVAAREGFDPAKARSFDVVLLDWSQRDLKDLASDMAKLKSPLGPREEWNTPTVLLGSAGLLIASPWQTNGAYG